jgi:uncharacterized membrane protein YbaN (DUF454 family)
MFHINVKKILYFLSGYVLLIVAYLGWILPGIPFSIPAVFAAVCFAKSNDRLHSWMLNHPKFGPFINNWSDKKIFPIKMKYMMIGVMVITVASIYVTTGNLKAVLYSVCFMIFGASWGWRYPSSEEEYQERVKSGKKIGWIR